MRLLVICMLCAVGMSLRAQVIHYDHDTPRGSVLKTVIILDEASVRESEYLLTHRWSLTRELSFSQTEKELNLADTTLYFVSPVTAEDSSYVVISMYRGGNGLTSLDGGIDSEKDKHLIARLYADYDLFNGALRSTYLLGLQTLGKWSNQFEDRDAMARRLFNAEHCEADKKIYVDYDKLRKPAALRDSDQRQQMGLSMVTDADPEALERIVSLPDPDMYLLDQVRIAGNQEVEVYTVVYRLNEGVVFAIEESFDSELEEGIPLTYLLDLVKEREDDPERDEKENKSKGAKEDAKRDKERQREGVSLYNMLQERTSRVYERR